MMLGCMLWWFLWVLLVGRFCGLFLDVALVFGGFFRLALVSPMYTHPCT
jgi:hypothetical protein